MDIFQRLDALSLIGPLVTTFLFGFTAILFLVWHSIRKQSYWRRLGVPYVKPLPIFGSLLDIIKKPLQDIELERYMKHGRIYGLYEGNRPLLSIADPELLRSILVKDFYAFSGRRFIQTNDTILKNMLTVLQGEDWKRVRTIVTPTFTTGKIKRMLSIFKDCSETLVKNFRKAAEKGEPVEVKRLYGTFTMDIIASSCFSTKIDSHNDPDNDFVKNARSIFSTRVNWRFVVFILLPRVANFFGMKVFPPQIMNFFCNATMRIMEERKRTGQKRNDFLQLLMDTVEEISQEPKLDVSEKDDIIDNYGKEDDEFILKNISSKKSLSSDELIAQCIIFFLAGYDTTASTLAFCSYLLALNPDVQEKLVQDIDDAFKETNEELTYEAIQNMKYLDNVISETLRIFPPAIRLERAATQEYKLADTGIIVPRGMLISIPIYAMHRDPKFFPDPEKFDADRFLPDERAKREQYSYLPFGAGPRNCVGLRFALMEVKVCLAYVLRNFKIKKCSKTKVPLDFYAGQGLLQPKEINVVFEIRKETVKSS